jgi:hypothetical protein
MQDFYGTIENPTDVPIYLTSVSFTFSSSGVVIQNDYIQGLIIYEKRVVYPGYGLLVPPKSTAWDTSNGPMGTWVIAANPLTPLPRKHLTCVMHLQGVLATDPTTVLDLGDLTIKMNPYLPIVSDINHKAFHYKASRDKGMLTIGGSIWNAYNLGYDTPTIATTPTLYGADLVIDAPGSSVQIVGQNLIDTIQLETISLPPGGPHIAFTGPGGMFVLQIPDGTPSFHCRLVFFSTGVEDLAVGYADFEVKVDDE